MKRLFLMRHGQAGTYMDTYDQLSDLGKKQAFAAGAHMKASLSAETAVIHGTLRRQRETAECFSSGAGEQYKLTEYAGFDEFSGDVWKSVAEVLEQENQLFRDLLQKYQAQLESNRRSLRTGVLFRKVNGMINRAWIHGEANIPDSLLFTKFRERVLNDLHRVIQEVKCRDIYIVSSVTPIYVIYCYVTGQSLTHDISLMGSIPNVSLSSYKVRKNNVFMESFNSKRLSVLESVTYI